MNGLATKKKILMLHGFVQSGKIFKAKTGGLRKSLRKLGYELYYPTAPDLVTRETLQILHGTHSKTRDEFKDSSVDLASEYNSSSGADELFGWYIRHDPNRNEFDIEEHTIQYLHDYILENGPFEGLIGFSQGAGLGGYLLTDINNILNLTGLEQMDLKFFISFSGFKLDDVRFHEAYEKNPISVPSLHVQGELDSVVTENRVISLYQSCQADRRTLLKHPGGHFVPHSRTFITQVCNWIQTSTGAVSPAQPRIKSQADAPSTIPSLDPELLDMIDSMGKI